MFSWRCQFLFCWYSWLGLVTCWSMKAPPRRIPITVFSGFLGAGKTSLLSHLLHHPQGQKIAIIVNDVASVNIDAKLLSSNQNNNNNNNQQDNNKQSTTATSLAASMVELQNGCACCSLSEELLSSVSELVMLSDLRAHQQSNDDNDNHEDGSFDHIVIELSGVADPTSVRAKFQEAVLYDMPLMDRVQLDTMVTLIDASVFLQQLTMSKQLTPEQAPEHFYPNGQEPPKTEQEDQDWQKDLPAPLLEALLAGERAYGAGSAATMGIDKTVADLLITQCEIADIVIINKCDLATSQQVSWMTQIIQALNPKARILTTEYGQVDLDQILGVAQGHGIVQAGLVDDHKDAVQAALEQQQQQTTESRTTDRSPQEYGHVHDHSHSHDHDNCNDPDCTDPSHSHSHDHDHANCDDPSCTDPSHSHDHFSHGTLGSFVYRARRPFHPERLVSFLRHLPIQRGLPDPTTTSTSIQDKSMILSSKCQQALQQVLRSKGFLWTADSDIAALYWSHAGTSLEISCVGRWWATLPREQWPPEAVAAILEDFDVPTHDEDAVSNTETVGDRRQEIVFIGSNMQTAAKEIIPTLDQCLLNDAEWADYCQLRRTQGLALREHFPNPFAPTTTSTSSR